MGLPWSSDRLVAGAATYRNHNQKDERHVINGIQPRGSNNQAASEPYVDCKATGIGTFYCLLYLI